MKIKGKERKRKTHTITHPPPHHHHHHHHLPQNFLLPKPVLWANPGKPTLLGSHSHHLLVAKSSVEDNRVKTVYSQLGTPFIAKGVHFGNQDAPHDIPTLDPYALNMHSKSDSLFLVPMN